MVNYLKKYLVSNRGPHFDSLDYAWGWTWSMWPMIGVRTLLGGLFFAVFKKPKAVFLITNQIGFVPFLLLYFPHLRLGEFFWGAPRLDYSFKEMWIYVSTDPFGSVVALLPSIGHAITGWVLLLPLHFFAGYGFMYFVFKRYEKN